MDYHDPQAFQALLRPVAQKVDQIAAQQEAAQVDPVTTELEDVFITLGKLISLGDIRSAIELGRAYLKRDHYDESTKIFLHLKDNVDSTNATYYKVLANLGYSLIGQGAYEAAISYLKQVEQFRNGSEFRVWHSLALAYANFKLGRNDLYQEWLMKSKTMPNYRRNIRFFESLYPEISDDL